MPAIELYCELWMCSGGESVAAAIPVRRYAAYSAWIHVPCQTTLPYLQPRADPRLPTRHRPGVTPQPKPARQIWQLLRYHTGHRFQSESTLQEIEIGQLYL